MISISITLATILLILAALHVYWVFGGRFGKTSTIPSSKGKPLFKPGPAGKLMVAAGLAAAAYVALASSGILSGLLSQTFLRIGCIILAIMFAVRAIGEGRYVGFFKRVKDTKFARLDTKFFSPLCVGISFGFSLLVYWS